MKLLFICSQTNLTRHFDSVLLHLADRGHRVHIASPRIARLPLSGALAGHPRISEGPCPDERDDQWRDTVKALRGMADYTRYLEPAFLSASKLRDRAMRSMVKALTNGQRTHLKARCGRCGGRIADDEAGRLLLAPGEPALAGFRRLLVQIEASVPSDAVYDRYLREQRPDAIVVTPMVNLEMSQADWVKAARACGVPAAFAVFSWDNLTTKGLVHVAPDRVFVWNAIQKHELVTYHGIPEDRVVITGAPRFDAFFSMTPSLDRAAFCGKFALDPRQPILTYLCSSEFVASDEIAFVREWIDGIRRDRRVAHCNLLIRPHPRLLTADWSSAGVAIAASGGMNADQLLFDTLHHSAAAVGLNTSAEIEAGILGKPVCTVLTEQFAAGQNGTLHFQYLLRANGGFVEHAHTLEEHRTHLAAALSGAHDADCTRAFIESFIRPAGLSQPVTPIFADAVERLAS